MVKVNSDCSTGRSCAAVASLFVSFSLRWYVSVACCVCPPSPSTVKPLLPAVPPFWDPWNARVSEPANAEERSEESLVSCVAEVLGDAVEGEDEGGRLDNKPSVSKRRLTFHIV